MEVFVSIEGFVNLQNFREILYLVKINDQANLRPNMIIIKYKKYYQASLGPNMIIKLMMKINDYQASPRLNMIIKVMKNNDYQVSLRLDMIINVIKIMIIKQVWDST